MKKDQVLGLLRHVLTLAGGALAASGGDTSLIKETTGVVLAVVSIAWSWIEKTRR